jgi:hypothetical protein
LSSSSDISGRVSLPMQRLGRISKPSFYICAPVWRDRKSSTADGCLDMFVKEQDHLYTNENILKYNMFEAPVRRRAIAHMLARVLE